MNHDKLPHSKFPSLLSVTTFSTPPHSHVFIQCWAVSLQKLRGSLTQAALGAFVDSCQLDQPLLALAVFSAFHFAPTLPQVLLGGSRRLCRRLSTRPVPSGVGRFFCFPQGLSCLLLSSYTVLFCYTPTFASKAIRFALLLASVSLLSVWFPSCRTQSS
jgi:hypothetical protein